MAELVLPELEWYKTPCLTWPATYTCLAGAQSWLCCYAWSKGAAPPWQNAPVHRCESCDQSARTTYRIENEAAYKQSEPGLSSVLTFFHVVQWLQRKVTRCISNTLSILVGPKSLNDTETTYTPAFTSWPLGVTAVKLCVQSTISITWQRLNIVGQKTWQCSDPQRPGSKHLRVPLFLYQALWFA